MFDKIKKELKEFDPGRVDVYVNYLIAMANEVKDNKKPNWWIEKQGVQPFVDIFKKVASDGMYIDGETITVQFRKKVIVSYNYQAYKNRLLLAYPESKIDIQLVHDGDDFSFKKESGRVIYTHRINDPFSTSRTIIGTYCIIKNHRGEFLETLNKPEIDKMRNVAKTQSIWNAWESEMILKSVIKRACKRHFKDAITNMDAMDNENYDLEKVNIDSDVSSLIEKCTTINGLVEIYKDKKAIVEDHAKFISMLGERKEELRSNLPEITEAEHPEAIKMLENGSKVDDLLNKWRISEDTREMLLSQAL